MIDPSILTHIISHLSNNVMWWFSAPVGEVEEPWAPALPAPVRAPKPPAPGRDAHGRILPGTPPPNKRYFTDEERQARTLALRAAWTAKRSTGRPAGRPRKAVAG